MKTESGERHKNDVAIFSNANQSSIRKSFERYILVSFSMFNVTVS